MIAEASRIIMYFHCKTCIAKKGKKILDKGELLAVGWTAEGIQVVCENCGKSVVDLDFLSQKISYYHGQMKGGENE